MDKNEAIAFLNNVILPDGAFYNHDDAQRFCDFAEYVAGKKVWEVVMGRDVSPRDELVDGWENCYVVFPINP